MKNYLLLTGIMCAIGTAIAHPLFDVAGYSRKIDVPGQVANCQFRDNCPNTGTNVCTANFDHDNNPNTTNITVTLYGPNQANCTVILNRP